MSRPSESAGELGYLAAAALLSDLAVRRATGQLAVWQGDTVKKVFCKNGNVVFATSNLPADRLGDVLLAQGMITPAQYEESASQVIATGRMQGTVLVQIGALTPKDLFRGLIAQVREIVLSLFAWDAGGWRFSEGLAAQEEIVSLRLSASALVAEGLLRAAADPRFTARWQPERLEISLASAPPLPAEELELPAAAGNLLAGIGTGLPWAPLASRTEGTPSTPRPRKRTASRSPKPA